VASLVESSPATFFPSQLCTAGVLSSKKMLQSNIKTVMAAHFIIFAAVLRKIRSL
jgi:hypothetical protein